MRHCSPLLLISGAHVRMARISREEARAPRDVKRFLRAALAVGTPAIHRLRPPCFHYVVLRGFSAREANHMRAPRARACNNKIAPGYVSSWSLAGMCGAAASRCCKDTYNFPRDWTGLFSAGPCHDKVDFSSWDLQLCVELGSHSVKTKEGCSIFNERMISRKYFNVSRSRRSNWFEDNRAFRESRKGVFFHFFGRCSVVISMLLASFTRYYFLFVGPNCATISRRGPGLVRRACSRLLPKYSLSVFPIWMIAQKMIGFLSPLFE